jgi:16S rRNA processing protein RimM
LKQRRIEAGKVRNTHALKGEVKFECWLDDDATLSALPRLYASMKSEEALAVKQCRRHGDILILKFENVDSVEQAELLKGKTLYAAREDLDPEDRKIFFADLPGLPLKDAASGVEYGKIKEVSNRGGGELLTIVLPNGEERYFPMVKEWIVTMDAQQGITVRIPEGLFD